MMIDITSRWKNKKNTKNTKKNGIIYSGRNKNNVHLKIKSAN